MQNEFAFPLSVSSLSDGKDCLWIGTETGSVAKFDPRTGRYSDPVFIDFGHVYCIREVYDDMLLVGIRNSGLKLVEIKDGNIAEIRTQFVLEGHRGINFSPYSFFVKQAEDAAGIAGATAPDTLFCGTSNGLFWFPMPQDCNGLDDREDLIPIYEKYDDPGIKFLSVVSCDGKVYGGSTEGLFKVMDADSEKADERFEILGKTPISHLSVSEGCLYVLDGRGRVYSSEQMEETVRYDRNIPLAFFCDDRFRFAVTPFNLNISDAGSDAGHISDTEGGHNIFPLNGRSAIGGEIDRGRECFLRYGNYYYVAVEHGICRIPVHLNLGSKVHLISATAGPSADGIYALSEKSGLYRIRPDGHRARFFRELKPDKRNAVKDLDGFIGRNLIFHTKDRVYSIRPGFFSRISTIKGIPDRTVDIQQVIVLPDSRIMTAYSDTSFIFDWHTRKITAMDIGADSYVSSVDIAPDKTADAGYRIWAGTLNKGLYQVDAKSGKCTEMFAGDSLFQSIMDLKATESSVHVLVPGRIVRIECNDGEWTVAQTAEVSHDVCNLFMNGDSLYAAYASGGIGSDRRLFPDISFLPEELGHHDSGDQPCVTGLISENAVIYDWSEDDATDNATDNISYAKITVPNLFVRMTSWKGGLGAVIFTLICIAALAATLRISHKIAKAFKTASDVLRIIMQRQDQIKQIRQKLESYSQHENDLKDELEKLRTLVTEIETKAQERQYLVSDTFNDDKQECNDLLNTIEKKLAALRQRREEVEVIRKKVDEYRPFKEAVDEELEELEKLIAKANDPQYLVSDSYKPDRKKCHELLKTMDRKISQGIQSIFDYQSSQLEKLCETNIISYNILDEYRDAIGSSDLQKAASVNESVTKIIDNLCSHKHWFRLLDEISADDRIVIYSDNSTIVENLKHLKATHKKIKNCKLEELITLSETLNSMIQTFSSENIHDAIRNIFIEHLKNSGIDTEEYIIKKVIDIISRTTDQLEFISKCMYNISHIEPLRKLSEIAKFIDTSLNELDEIRSEDKDFNIGENKKRRDNLIKDFGAHAFGLYEKLCDEDKDILKACTMKVTNEKYETFLVFLSAIYGIKNTPGKKTHIRYLCRRPTSAVEFEKSKSKLREKFLLYDNLNKSTYNQAVVVPALFETAIKFYGRSQKDNKSPDSAEE